MPRVNLLSTAQDTAASRIIFGSGGVVKKSAIDKKLRFPHGSCAKYIKAPYKMPLDRFAAVSELMELTDAQIVAAVKTYYKKGSRR